MPKAEVLWVLKVAYSGFSYNSYSDIPGLFKAMFPGKVSEDFAMSKSKISYVISDGIGPHLRKTLVNQITSSKVSFTLQYDETGTGQNKKNSSNS